MTAPLLERRLDPLPQWRDCLGSETSRPILYLLRHCETEWNQAKLYQGRSDPPLSASGLLQAQTLAEELAPVLSQPITLLSSPLMRARTTAAILASRAEATAMIDHRLTELSYGSWEGYSQQAIKLLWPDMLRQWKRTPDTVAFPGGEALRDLQARVRSFLVDAAESDGPIFAVTHDGVIRLALLEAQGLPLSAFRTVKIDPGKLVAFCRHRSGISPAITWSSRPLRERVSAKTRPSSV
jgi:broad specificity phosphatase PhoE